MDISFPVRACILGCRALYDFPNGEACDVLIALWLVSLESGDRIHMMLDDQQTGAARGLNRPATRDEMIHFAQALAMQVGYTVRIALPRPADGPPYQGKPHAR